MARSRLLHLDGGADAASAGHGLADDAAATTDLAAEGLLHAFSERVQQAHLEQQAQAAAAASRVTPVAGFVVKTRLLEASGAYPAQLKLFVNVCHSPEIPAPPLASDAEIQAAIAAGDPARYKVPLSLSALQSDRDRAGKTCLIIDAAVHSRVYAMANRDPGFRHFLIQLALQWIEQKHTLPLDMDYVLPKAAKKGAISVHTIHRPKRPHIELMDSSEGGPSKSPGSAAPASAAASTLPPRRQDAVRTKNAEDDGDAMLTAYTIDVAYGDDGVTPAFLVVAIQLPQATRMANAALDVEPRRLLLQMPSYQLQAALPHAVDIEAGGAQFDHRTRVLTVTLECLAATATAAAAAGV
ncbi:hypothetical protein CXG81DRAFT_15072 [Caulochytrium protostelioides]|uniref:PIH1 domain-containing protein 1 n=1 Tax=Caulochytrium protostelioides TaxID=1555241 RepID=A0A4P9X2U3_9FUNG|nr:hypothetical protein CXG81DRAFT_15072 [Caulochytrium protostelioides]|eukprot:RKO99066.1 hypothetical protein CXG81DRAFT_15072 [Caulochytrium protostelioides]